MSGNFSNDLGHIVAPPIKFPITDMAYGSKLGRKFCDLEFRDYRECVTMDKQTMRNTAIRNERWKQWLRGDRAVPFEEDHIKVGMYRPHHYSNELPT